MTAGLSSGWGSNIAFLHIISHIWIFACSEMKACLQQGGPEGWKCRGWLPFWSASLIWQPGWRLEPTARLGALAGAVGALWVLGNVTFLLLRLWDFCSLFQASNNSLKLWNKITFHLTVNLGCLIKPVVTRAGVRGVCIPAFPVSVSDPGSALQNQEWSLLLSARSKMFFVGLLAELLREKEEQGLSTGT